MGNRSSRRGGGGFEGTEQDFELNLAPIIDCFTFIIVFLLTSASFVTVGVLDVNSLAPLDEAVAAAAPAPDAPDVVLKLRGGNSITLEYQPVRGGAFQSIAYNGDESGLPVAAVIERLKKIKESSPELAGATILASDDVRYKDLVRTVEAVRDVLPGVAIGNRPLEAR